MSSDTSQRFIFGKTDIRGEWVQLENSYQEILAIHPYPEVVRLLLGEFLAASVLLGSTLKFEGRLIMQVRGSGEIPLLMAEATHDKKIRAIARLSDDVSSVEFDVLFKDATLVVSVEPTNGERYQSLVPLLGHDLATCLSHYFAQSEQLCTFIKLSSNGSHAGGILLQQLPKQLVKSDKDRESQWQHVSILAQTSKPEELLSLNAEDLLNRLYVNEALRLLETSEIAFQCSCSEERTARALVSIDPKEFESLFEEKELLEMHCEFCQKKYEFTREAVAVILRGDKTAH